MLSQRGFQCTNAKLGFQSYERGLSPNQNRMRLIITRIANHVLYRPTMESLDFQAFHSPIAEDYKGEFYSSKTSEVDLKSIENLPLF